MPTKNVRTTKKTTSKIQVSQIKANSSFSSKRVLLVFIVAFAVIGGVIIRFSHAAVDPAVDAAVSNEKAYQAIRANAAAAGVTITEKRVTQPKPADFGQLKVVDPTGSDRRSTNGVAPSAGATDAATNAPIPRPDNLPVFPQLPPPKSAGNDNGSWLFPKAHADDWTRAYTVYYAQQFMGWRGRDFFYYGTFPNGDQWCSDFMSYVTMRAGKPFWTGADGWRMQFSGDVANLMYWTGSLRSRDSTPVAGDFVFFDWRNGGTRNDHIGLVESVDAKGNIHTIEGNIIYQSQYDSIVARQTWSRNDPHILAYGHWW